MKFTINNKEVVFIHIPRTAGTYIENVICKKYNIDKKWPISDKNILFGLLKQNNKYFTLQHLTFTEMHKYNFINVDKNIFYFSIIRNPFDRVISLYSNWGGDKRFKTFDIFLNKLLSFNMDNYDHNGIITENSNFNYKNMSKNLKDCMYHFLPQYKYVYDASNNIKVNTYKINEMNKLNNILNVNLKFSKTRNKKFKQINKEQIDKIVKIYKKDFEIFNYSTIYNVNMNY